MARLGACLLVFGTSALFTAGFQCRVDNITTVRLSAEHSL